MNNDPLKYYYNKYGFDFSEIKRIETGKHFIAVVLNNRNLGICARLSDEIETDLLKLKSIDLDFDFHRSILTAYYNAKLNYNKKIAESADIIEDIKSGNYSSVVMIGYFTSLLRKFKELGIEVSVFDFDAEDVVPIEHQKEYLAKADAVILTSTTILNRTFSEVMKNTNPKSDIFIVGPSSTFEAELFVNSNIKKIHGALFNPEDEKIIKMIKEGKKPKDFLFLAKKVTFDNQQ